MVVFALGDRAPSPYEQEVPSDRLIGWQESAARLANAHLACLVAAIGGPMLSPSSVATFWSMMHVDFDTGNFLAASDPTSGGTRIALYQARMGVGLDDWRFYRSAPLVTTEQLVRSFELLDAVLQRPATDMALLRAELLFRAVSALMHQDTAGGLTSAWGAMEGLLGDLLTRYLDENENRDVGQRGGGQPPKFINSDRRKFLGGSEMTARHTVEVLSLLDVLPFELYRASTQCARARNAWLHKQTEPSREIVWTAVVALGELFELVERVPLRIRPDP
jgi:hypothetical protein